MAPNHDIDDLIIRPITTADIATLGEVSSQVGHGFTSLPDNHN